MPIEVGDYITCRCGVTGCLGSYYRVLNHSGGGFNVSCAKGVTTWIPTRSASKATLTEAEKLAWRLGANVQNR